jgi:hypothetical protein
MISVNLNSEALHTFINHCEFMDLLQCAPQLLFLNKEIHEHAIKMLNVHSKENLDTRDKNDYSSRLWMHAPTEFKAYPFKFLLMIAQAGLPFQKI